MVEKYFQVTFRAQKCIFYSTFHLHIQHFFWRILNIPCKFSSHNWRLETILTSWIRINKYKPKRNQSPITFIHHAFAVHFLFHVFTHTKARCRIASHCITLYNFRNLLAWLNFRIDWHIESLQMKITCISNAFFVHVSFTVSKKISNANLYTVAVYMRIDYHPE